MVNKKLKTGKKEMKADEPEPDGSELQHKGAQIAQLELLLSGYQADCKIKCQGYEWKVHQAILCRRSEYFEKAFQGNFQEGSSKVLNWDQEDPHAVENLLIYLYSLAYPRWDILEARGLVRQAVTSSTNQATMIDPNEGAEAEESVMITEPKPAVCNCVPAFGSGKLQTVPPKEPWVTDIQLFSLADRINIRCLKHFATRKLHGAIVRDFGKASFLLLLQQVWELDGTGSEDLRGHVTATVCKWMPQMLEDPDFCKMLDTTQGFALAILLHMQDKIEGHTGTGGTRGSR